MSPKAVKTDYLIIGSGISGISLAIKISKKFPDKTVGVITKSNEDESNTKYAQGGIAVVTNLSEDSHAKHIEDTLVCGDGLCNREVVEMVVKDGTERLRELIEWGAKFDKNNLGELDLGKEGGHSNHRVIHHKDQTGFEIERAILSQAKRQKNINILDYHFALDLIVSENRCCGAYILDEKNGQIMPFISDYTILATGGIGQVYGHTTNPTVATGDGIAMASRVKAKVEDMEFIQFHPTALYNDNIETTFLISEAVRGFGAFLRNKKGERFMLQYDKRGELASRDIVSRSIYSELKKSGEPCVFIDCTHLDIKAFKNHFPMIYKQCKSIGISPEKDWIPVAPSQHYICGGILVNKDGQTSVENLFACGECSRTGLHGANRLASNSLLEALVYSERIYQKLVYSHIENNPVLKPLKKHNTTFPEVSRKFIGKRKKELQSLMLKCAGIIRNDIDLQIAENQLVLWKKEMETMEKTHKITKDFYELKNIIETGILIVEHSVRRTENRGAFVKELL